ncbi:MAG TPA: FHA domain-containing protein [Candidatus Limnocylindria bacterium]
MKLFESLKRLLEPRARPPVETVGAPTADRPPPREPEPLPEPELLREPASPDVIPTVAETSDVSEVRALLEAVAEAPEPAESVAEAPAPTPPPEPTPTLFQESTEEVVDVPSAAPARVGDALVLTLATPPATFTVAKAAATIGRGQENTIRLDDLSVSRRHARIAYKQGGYWLSDTGSMGGTWVDGTRLNAPYRVGPGQIIDIGLCRLTVSFAVASADKKERKPRTEVAAPVRRRR